MLSNERHVENMEKKNIIQKKIQRIDVRKGRAAAVHVSFMVAVSLAWWNSHWLQDKLFVYQSFIYQLIDTDKGARHIRIDRSIFQNLRKKKENVLQSKKSVMVESYDFWTDRSCRSKLRLHNIMYINILVELHFRVEFSSEILRKSNTVWNIDHYYLRCAGQIMSIYFDWKVIQSFRALQLNGNC